MAKTITVVGLGYVGLPVACLCAEKGLKVYGFEISSEKVSSINKWESPIKDDYISGKLLQLKSHGIKIHATTNPAECIPFSDAVIICVPTPIDRHNSPDLTALMESTASVSKHIKKELFL